MTDRRSLIKSLAGAALLGATAANAQRAKSVTIGYLALLPGDIVFLTRGVVIGLSIFARSLHAAASAGMPSFSAR